MQQDDFDDSGLLRRAVVPVARRLVESPQPALFPVRSRLEFPNQTQTADAWGVVEGDDSHRYYVKGERGGEKVRAAEWVATNIAREIGIDCPAPAIVQMSDGQLLFGSREIARASNKVLTAQILTTATPVAGGTRFPGLRAWLSKLYAFDMFINNIDRHLENYLSIQVGSLVTFYPIDFARSFCWAGPLESFPSEGQNTRGVGRVIRALHGFDATAALATVETVIRFTQDEFQRIVMSMPPEWDHDQCVLKWSRWWSSESFREKAEKLRKGLLDGSLL